MNLDTFFEHFEKFVDAPNDVEGMRELILQLAVRGQLVPQDPGDGKAADLLPRLEAGRRRLVQDRLAPKTAPSTNGLKPWFAIPEQWKWVSLSQVGAIVGGGTPKTSNRDYYSEDGVPWLTPADLYNYKDRYISRGRRDISPLGLENSSARLLPAGTVLFSSRAPIGYTAIAQVPISTNQGFKSCVPFVKESSEYIYWYLRSAAKRIDAEAPGTTFREVSGKAVSAIPFPLPPLAEQKRIVAKVDELMALCDRLEEQQRERDAQHEQIVRAATARFNQSPTPKTLNLLFHKNYQIPPAELRKTILNLAVSGKLVSQDPKDEPAEEILRRAQSSRQELGLNPSVKQSKPLTEANRKRLPFELPGGWSWIQLGEICLAVTSGSRGWAKYYSKRGAIFLRMGNLSRDSYRLRLKNIQHVTPPSNAEGDRTRLECGDILISITGEVGLLGLVPEDFGEAYINQHTCLVRLPKELHTRFIAEFFRSSFAQDQFNEPQRGLKNSFRLTDVTTLLTPLPPLAEQKRIVAKVDRLMALVDQLEAAQSRSRTLSEQLMDAVLAGVAAEA